MLRNQRSTRVDSSSKPKDTPKEYSWTEELLCVEQANLFSESIGEGKTSYSVQLELLSDPESSSNLRKRTEMRVCFGLEEKDVLTFARLLGRKILVCSLRLVDLLEREKLEEELLEYKKALQESEAKVSYLNDSLHHYVQGTRKL